MSAPLFGQMMTLPLQVSSLITHAARWHGDRPIVSRLADGRVHRYGYRECERRSRRLARALQRQGVEPGERLATLAWNSFRHLELYFGIAGAGAVCHTVNPRLHLEQIVFIVNDAQDTWVFFDANLAPLIEALAPRCPRVRRWVCLCAPEERPASQLAIESYEAMLEAGDDDFRWPALDERTACSLCYTSGTTGNPKGVLYSHRATVLHSIVACLPDANALDAATVVLPIVPMFHVNAWGLPYASCIVGAKLVLPGPRLDPASLYELIETERATLAAAVPTVWIGLLEYLEAGERPLHSLRRALIGGAAVPVTLIRALARHGIEVRQGWGMTETGPLVTTSAPLARHLELSTAERQEISAQQGRPLFGTELALLGPGGEQLPFDGQSMGQVMVRGHWIAERYFPDIPAAVDGWLPTGDIGTLDTEGFLQLRDRAKDLIKSGGEWISSIDLESIAVAHPAVQHAACIARPHPRWGERPLLLAVLKPGQILAREQLLAHFEGKIARWAIPDDVLFVTELPLTATGKLNKLKLRELLGDYCWPEGARTREPVSR